MTNLDYGRIKDLEDLVELKKKSRSNAEREDYEFKMYKIINEGVKIREIRERMIHAMRGGDTREVRRLSENIILIKKQNGNYN